MLKNHVLSFCQLSIASNHNNMSAKEHYRTAPVVLPDLPPEIWSSIFRLATWSTDIFNPQLMVFAGCDTSHWEQLRGFKRSLVSFLSFFLLLGRGFI